MKKKEDMLIPFGKYKGQPLEVLQHDQQYAEWLTSQDWFRQKFQPIYNIIINNFGEPAETPEHNQMQVKFLNEEWRLKTIIALQLSISKFDHAVFFKKAQEILKRNSVVVNKIIESTKQRISKLQEVISEHTTELNEEKEFSYTLPPCPFREDKKETSRYHFGKRAYSPYGIQDDPRVLLHQAIQYIQLFKQYLQILSEQMSKGLPCFRILPPTFEEKGFDVCYEIGVRAELSCELPKQIESFLDYNTYSHRSGNYVSIGNCIFNEGKWPMENPVWEASFRMSKLFIELKPSIGDDFPSILRQIKANRQRVKRYDKGEVYWILIVGSYNGKGATYSEVQTFFQNEGILVIQEQDIARIDLERWNIIFSMPQSGLSELFKSVEAIKGYASESLALQADTENTFKALKE